MMVFNPTVIIYIYIYIIVSLIVFDIFYTLNDKVQAKKGKRKLYKYKESIQVQIDKIGNGEVIDKEHLRNLYWKLRGINNLLTYQEAIRQLKLIDCEKVDKYLIMCSPVLQFFAHFYGQKDSIYKAFFAAFLSKYYPFHLGGNSIIDEAIMKYVEYNSIYCRENAMLYFYERGSSNLVVTALKKIDEAGLYYNRKLLSNDLLKFKGDKKKLAKQLFEEFDSFSVSFQVSIVNYLRFSSIDLNDSLFQILISKSYDKEVNLAIIRYFGKNVYSKILPYLLTILKMDDIDVEYKIIVCQIISVYDCKDVRDALITCVSSSNWYVRKNAASSLAKMKVTVSDKEKLLGIKDKYGKQMLKYTFKAVINKNKKKGEVV